MPKKVVTKTGKGGESAAERRILAGVTDVTAAPVLPSDGYLINRNEYIHLLFSVENSGADPVFALQVWWYSFISGLWHRGEPLTVNNQDLVTMEVQGLDRVYLQVTAKSGTLPILDAWLALVVPV